MFDIQRVRHSTTQRPYDNHHRYTNQEKKIKTINHRSVVNLVHRASSKHQIHGLTEMVEFVTYCRPSAVRKHVHSTTNICYHLCNDDVALE